MKLLTTSVLLAFAAGCTTSNGRGPTTGTGGGADMAGPVGPEGDMAEEPLPSPTDDGGPPSTDDAAVTTHDPATCDEAKMLASYVGCDYWPTVTANAVWSIFDFTVVVSNPGSMAADVTVTGPNNTMQMATVPPNQLVKIFLPWVSGLKTADVDNCGRAAPVTASVDSPKGAFHLVSTLPVIVYQFSPLEYAGMGGPSGKNWSSCPGDTKCTAPGAGNMAVGCYSFSNDASLLLPSTAMTGNYRVFAQKSAGTASFMTITATTDNTTVKVKLASTAKVSDGSGVTFPAGAAASFTMNAGDVKEFILAQNNTSGDFSGSLVQADKPVQVITGDACINNPLDAAACDHVEETLFPAETLGKDYVVTVPTGPSGTPVGHTVRVYGNVDNTHLTLKPAIDGKSSITINAGQVVDLGMAAYNFPPFVKSNNGVTTDFEISGDHEFAVASFQLGGQMVDPTATTLPKGDPSVSYFAAVEQYRDKYVFLAPDDYTSSFADVVVPKGAHLMLDGAAVSTSPTAIPGTNYGVLRLKLTGMSGAHTMSGDLPFGVQVVGYGSNTSYQYPGGLDLKQIAPPPPPVS